MIRPVAQILTLWLLTQSPGIPALRGAWMIENPIEGSPRKILVFGRNGSFTSTIGVVVKGTYTVADSRVAIRATWPDVEQPEDGFQIRIDGEELVLEPTPGVDREVEGEQVRLKRLSPVARTNRSIVGSWGLRGGFLHGPENGLIEFRFTRDGRFSLRLLRGPERGRYKIRGNMLTTSIEINDTKRNSFTIEGGRLVIKSEAAGEERYIRVE